MPVTSRGPAFPGAGKERRRLVVTGTVQGVGFRPFVYQLAAELALSGEVYNSGQGVVVEIEGRPEALAAFVARLSHEPPRLARIASLQVEELAPVDQRGFSIRESRGQAGGRTMVPPDVATCADCRREVLDPADRHYLYPFTNCTNCGPRYTITRTLPYDRARTSMAGFSLCAACAGEYRDPGDRRFHAQPVACPACGPQVELVDARNRAVPGPWLEAVAGLLDEGRIVAVKGLGGFHLACDAENQAAVADLRRRKHRPAKPLAVMFASLAEVRHHLFVSPAEEEALTSPAAPIVILRRRPGSPLPPDLAPGLKSLGAMLPYTPVHHLLLAHRPGPLVMTSGNVTGLPLVTGNAEALASLGEAADFFLIHNREILNRCDDSLGQVVDGDLRLLRRSRGYVPAPLKLAVPAGPVTLGIGGEMKNTLCLLQGDQAYLSQHVGAVDTLEGQRNLQGSLAALVGLTGAQATAVAFDLHPGYQSSRLARSLPGLVPCGVQHHHAHLASAMAENGLTGEVLGIILDGTGYGTDGRIWGFEILRGGYLSFSREAHLAWVPLAGGEQAVRKTWLSAISYLTEFLGEEGRKLARERLPVAGPEIALVEQALARRVNSPPVSSCGRLFDAVASLLGLCQENTYEGQAAATLGDHTPWAVSAAPVPYPYGFKGRIIDPGPLLAAVAADLVGGVATDEIALRFHDTVVAMVVEVCAAVRAGGGPGRVVLAGGTWYNRYLVSSAVRELTRRGFAVYPPRLVPAGDGGLALGQAVIARCRLAEGIR